MYRVGNSILYDATANELCINLDNLEIKKDSDP
jgi:hypothetical protein